MTDYKELFNLILNQEAKINLDTNKIVLKEKNYDKNFALQKVTIENNRGEFVSAYKLDKFSPFSKFFNKKNKEGINKGIDAFIVLFYNNEYYLLFIELKSTKILKRQIAQKMFASIAFIKNIKYILSYFYNTHIDNFKSGAVVIALKKSTQLAKPQIRPTEIEFKNVNYEINEKQKIQILEIKKESSGSFTVKIDKLIKQLRAKQFKNWPKINFIK